MTFTKANADVNVKINLNVNLHLLDSGYEHDIHTCNIMAKHYRLPGLWQKGGVGVGLKIAG